MERWKHNVYICTLGAFITSMGMRQLAAMLQACAGLCYKAIRTKP